MPAWEQAPEDSIQIDELFEGGYKAEDARNSTYNKVLARVHRTIRTTSRVRKDDRFCYFTFPDVLIGCAMYDKDACVRYVLGKLEHNGFQAVFVYPSMLVVSWKHWIHDRQRAEIYERTGLKVDGMGNVKTKRQGAAVPVNLGSALMALGRGASAAAAAPEKERKPLGIYDGLGLQSRLS